MVWSVRQVTEKLMAGNSVGVTIILSGQEDAVIYGVLALFILVCGDCALIGVTDNIRSIPNEVIQIDVMGFPK
jgi:hypothetical protein